VLLLRQALLVVAAGVVAGLGANALSPRPAPLGQPVHAAAEAAAGACLADPSAAPVARIAAAEAAALCTACSAGFVDARSARDFAAGHVTGAVHLPPAGHGDEAEALARLATFHTVVVYDGEDSCRLAESVARRLLGRGLRDVRVLDGAWGAWMAAGGPGSSGACVACQHGPEATR
jgi:3-mercaptopyruvate sulfurtransferase SseA